MVSFKDTSLSSMEIREQVLLYKSFLFRTFRAKTHAAIEYILYLKQSKQMKLVNARQ